jgi:PAS domain S-box-containing protein
MPRSPSDDSGSSAGEGRHRAVLSVLDEGIVVHAPDGAIADCNPSACRILGLSEDQLLGRDSTDPRWRTVREGGSAFLPDGHPATITRLTGRPCRGVIMGIDHPGGERTWISINSVPLEKAGIAPFTAVVSFTDITPLKAHEHMSAMGTLLADVSHEVRNPLFGITVTLDALEAEAGEPARFGRYFDSLRREARRLSDLMQDLLDFSKPGGGALALGAVGEVLAEAIEACAPLARRHGVAVDLELEPGLPDLPLDARRLGQVFRNLLENAQQHSPPGGRVTVRALLATREAVVCSVEDEGPGIPPLDLHRVFLPFFSRREHGTGLGLALARRLVELHGGEIEAGNRPEGGARFAVTLPLPAGVRDPAQRELFADWPAPAPPAAAT